MNIVNCALLGAFVLSMPEWPDVERLTDFYEYPGGSGYEGEDDDKGSGGGSDGGGSGEAPDPAA